MPREQATGYLLELLGRICAGLPDEDPDFAGGSYVLVQRYLHDLAAWDVLAVAEQERVVSQRRPGDWKQCNRVCQ